MLLSKVTNKCGTSQAIYQKSNSIWNKQCQVPGAIIGSAFVYGCVFIKCSWKKCVFSSFLKVSADRLEVGSSFHQRITQRVKELESHFGYVYTAAIVLEKDFSFVVCRSLWYRWQCWQSNDKDLRKRLNCCIMHARRVVGDVKRRYTPAHVCIQVFTSCIKYMRVMSLFSKI